MTPPRLSLSMRLRTWSAIGVARLLSTMRPGRLEKSLRALSAGARPATREEALRSYEAVVATSARCAGRWCLQRSVAVSLLCRSSGCWPEWQSGACLMPFRAHAWVAVDGVPVGEDPALADYFRPVISVHPRRATVQEV
jgi:hypothetical protein